jgi:hypothetical protein
MATGYKISTGVDLDTLFKARTSAAAANVGYLNSVGTDLSQLFEPRGSTTARANVLYRNASAVDLSQIFMDINTAPTLLNLTLTAANSGSNTGYTNSASGYTALGSMSGTPEWTISSVLYRLDQCTSNVSVANDLLVRVSNASSTPPDSDLCWTFIALTGSFATGGSGRKILLRSSRYLTNTGTTPNSRPMRLWQFNQAGMEMIAGNAYTFELG